MKTIFKTLVLCCLIAVKAIGQEKPAEKQTTVVNPSMNYSAFSDAELLMTASGTLKKEILSHYFQNKEDIQKFNKVYEDILKLPEEDLGDLDSLDKSVIQGSNGTLSLFQSKGVDALGTFIANRFKQEINIAFLDKFKEGLDSIPHLKTFFPSSHDVLSKSDPYNYPVFINTLREAFDNDLTAMPVNLPAILKDLNIKDPELKSELQLIATLINIKNINSLPSTINTILINDDLKLPDALKQDFRALSFAINMVKKDGNNLGSFIDGSDVERLKNATFRNYYFSLLFKQNEEYIASLKSLDVKKERILKLKSIIESLRPQYEAIAAELTRVNSNYNKTSKISLDDVQKSTSVFLTSFENTITILEKSKIIIVTEHLKGAIKKGKDINNIIGFIADKKYGLALVNLTDFILTLESNKPLKPEEKVLLKKYTAFIANCLDAKSKDELVTALETSANPVGSYRIKRNSTFNIGLNAYAGGFVGSNFHKDNATVFGFTAPVGLYFGWGNIGKKEADLDKDTGQSFGFFIPLVDVGAVTAFRIQDSETEMAEVSWNNVFAPGIYTTYGFRKCPISLNAGGQVGPELKKVNSDGTLVFVKKEWYWRFGIVVDISIFDFLIVQKAYKLEKK
jgi:hypothetical protein